MEKKFVFPKVDLPEVGRSNHNLDKSIMFSFSPGTARPIWSRDVLPGDHWEVSFNASIESLPMLAPLYGAFKANWAFYFEPWSNVYGYMDNNKRQSTEQIIKNNLLRYTLPVYATGDAESVIAPVHEYSQYFNEDDDTFVSVNTFVGLKGVQPSSVWEDFGWPTDYKPFPNKVSGYTMTLEDFENQNWYVDPRVDPEFLRLLDVPTGVTLLPQHLHAIKPIAYLDIVRNYYVNNQMNKAYYIGFLDDYGNVPGGFTPYNATIASVDLEVLDYLFALLRSLPSESYHVNIQWQTLHDFIYRLEPLNGCVDLHRKLDLFIKDWQASFVLPNGGCFLTNYAMDLNRGLLASSVGNYKSVVDTSNGNFSIETLRMQNKLQQLIDILDLTGGRFSDWVRALWSVNIKGDVDKPIYIGSVSQTIATSDIISPSTTAGSLAGSQTGFAAGGLSSRKISFNSDIYGTIMCVFSFTPLVSYSCLFKREDLKTSFQGVYNPRMAQLGYQDVPAKVLTAQLPKNTVGYVVSNEEEPYVAIGIPDYVDGVLDRVRPVNFPVAIQDSELSDFNPDLLVGRQVAWAEYMSDIDENRGIFALDQNSEYWVLNRDYFYTATAAYNNIERTRSIPNFATFVDPANFQNLFTDVEPNAQNFRQFIKFNVFVKRPIPKRTLGRL